MPALAVIPVRRIDGLLHFGEQAGDVFHLLAARVFGGFHDIRVAVFRGEARRLRGTPYIVKLDEISAGDVGGRGHAVGIGIRGKNGI